MQKTEGFVAKKMKRIMRAAIRDLPRGLLSTTKCYNTDCTFFRLAQNLLVNYLAMLFFKKKNWVGVV